ncbi:MULTISPECIES: PRTRC system ThiF family protein [unclassified Pseudoalteromonas]|uniref:PRTRC system ThiF family protein n=1 Tax=unclassified Pseudoalteromonas TaxID=194690 RepID=UPI00041801B1|nr:MULTISPECIES: PRTRC system ThiF family protein [unclassified Pseudoalteromonas]
MEMSLNNTTSRTFYIPQNLLDGTIKIALVGVGSTGSSMLTELFQLNGVLTKLGFDGLHVTAYDGDVVTPSNIYRQNFWAHDINLSKSEVSIKRLNQFGNVNWEYETRFFNQEDAKKCNFDILITAVDKASVRYEIGQALSELPNKGLWLDLGNDNHRSNVLLGSLNKNGTGGVNRLPSPFELFGGQWLESSKNENDTPSCSTQEAIAKQTFGINGMTARSASSMLLFPLLKHGELKHHGLFIDLHDADISKMPVDPLQWSMYGYEEE